MASIQINNINYINYGPTQSFISLTMTNNGTPSCVTLVTDIPKNKLDFNTALPDNINSLYYYENILYPVYDIRTLCIKSDVIKNKLKTDNNTLDIYSPPINDILHICTFQNYVYTLISKQQYAIQYKQISSLQYDNMNNYIFQYSNNLNNTYIYEKPKNEYDSNIQDRFNILTTNINDEYNYLLEIPIDGQYNNYISGDIYGNAYPCKNVFNSTYSMSVDNDKLASKINRDYVTVNKFNNNLYMTYYSDDSKYQHVEIVDSLNRYTIGSNHKSNMYSIKINNINLTTLTSFASEADKQIDNNHKDVLNIIYKNLKADIKNNIRDLTKKLCPVNTELFDVYID
jgi:hypothetical protein